MAWAKYLSRTSKRTTTRAPLSLGTNRSLSCHHGRTPFFSPFVNGESCSEPRQFENSDVSDARFSCCQVFCRVSYFFFYADCQMSHCPGFSNLCNTCGSATGRLASNLSRRCCRVRASQAGRRTARSSHLTPQCGRTRSNKKIPSNQ